MEPLDLTYTILVKRRTYRRALDGSDGRLYQANQLVGCQWLTYPGQPAGDGQARAWSFWTSSIVHNARIFYPPDITAAFFPPGSPWLDNALRLLAPFDWHIAEASEDPRLFLNGKAREAGATPATPRPTHPPHDDRGDQ